MFPDAATFSRRTFVKLLVGSIRLPMALFAGAGISRPSGLPTFDQFCSHVLRAIIGDVAVPRGDFLIFVQRLRPEVLIQALVDHFGAQALEFYDWFASGLPNANHYFLAKALEAGHCVFTTNVDQLIEKACHDLGIGYELCVTDDQYKAALARRSNRHGAFNPCGCLFKLHGNIHLEQYDARFETIQFALNQVGRGISESRRLVLEHCLASMDFAFLGYSGMDHFSVHPVLVGTPSQRHVFWLRFDPRDSRRIQTSRSAFRRELDRQLTTALAAPAGRQRVDWESLSVAEILSQRQRALHWRGDTSTFIAEIMSDAGVSTPRHKHRPTSSLPSWTHHVPRWKRHYFVARLYHLVLNTEGAELHCRAALKHARRLEAQADVFSLLGDTYLVGSSEEAYQKAMEAYLQAGRRYEQFQEWHRAILLKLDCVNTFRRMREFGKSLDELAAARQLLRTSPLPRGEKDYLKSYGTSLEGLSLGMRGGVPQRQMDRAIHCCQVGVALARRIGNVRRCAAALNNEGLVRFEAGKANPRYLAEARACLEESLALNARVGDLRSCFQNCHNLGLVHLHDALMKKGVERRAGLERALQTGEATRRYLAYVQPPPKGEVVEVDYRYAEVLIELGRRSKARPLLRLIAPAYRRLGYWYREARALALLLRATDDPRERFKTLRRIRQIYENALGDNEKKASFLDDKVRLANAKEIVRSAKEAARRLKGIQALREFGWLANLGRELATLRADA